MLVKNNYDNLVYDSNDERCSVELCMSQGQLYAFIGVLDIGMPHCRLTEPHLKYYWGKYSWEDEEGSVEEIMDTGGKWPKLMVR